MHSPTGQHGRDPNTNTIATMGATLNLQEKVVRQVSAASVDSPCGSHQLTTAHLGNDPDQQSLCALDRPQIGLRNAAGPAIAALSSPDGKAEDEKTTKVRSMLFLVKRVGCLVARPTRRMY